MFQPVKLLMAAGLGLFAALASAAGDVGMIDRLGGDVAVKSGTGTNFKASAFMKVREGDTFTLPKGSELQIVYFDGRRRELWQGPASLRTGKTGSEALTGAPAAITEAKGAPTREALTQAGNVQRLGTLVMREGRAGPPYQPTDEVIANYNAWTASAAPDDILPELYILSVLQDREMVNLKPYLDALKRKQPERADIKALTEQLSR